MVWNAPVVTGAAAATSGTAIGGIFRVIGSFIGGFWSMAFGFLIASLPWIIEKIIKFIGLTVVTYTGIDLVFDQIESWIFTQFEGLPSDMFQIMVLGDFDYAIKVCISAAVAGLTLRAYQNISLANKGTGSLTA